MVPVAIDPSTTKEATPVPVIQKPTQVTANPPTKPNNKKVEAFFIPRKYNPKVIEANQSIEVNEKKDNKAIKVTSSPKNSQITNE